MQNGRKPAHGEEGNLYRVVKLKQDGKGDAVKVGSGVRQAGWGRHLLRTGARELVD